MQWERVGKTTSSLEHGKYVNQVFEKNTLCFFWKVTNDEIRHFYLLFAFFATKLLFFKTGLDMQCLHYFKKTSTALNQSSH